MLNWAYGHWETAGKDLETALQSQEARACSGVRVLVEKAFWTLSPLLHSLWLNDNQLSSLPDSIGQLTNLATYGVRLVI